MKPGHLLGAGIIVIIMGLGVGEVLVVIPGMLVTIVGVLSWVWANHLLASVSWRIGLSQDRCHPGEVVSGHVELENDQPFPIPWLECSLDWPNDLAVSGGTLSGHYKSNRSILRYIMSLRWFERVTRRFQVRGDCRGEFLLGPARLSTADPFGLFEGSKDLKEVKSLVVFPRVLEVKGEPLLGLSPFGKRAAPSWVYDDPLLFRGTREYRPTDPFCRIEWKATARTGRLQTRLMDASFMDEVALVANVSGGEHPWNSLDRNHLERTLLVAASLARQCYLGKIRFGVFTNGFVRGGWSPAATGMGAGRGQFMKALHLLGRIMVVPGAKSESVLASTARKAGDRTRILLITPVLTGNLLGQVEKLRRQGRGVSVVLTQGEAPGHLLRVPLYMVEEEGPWNELQQLTLRRVS